MSLSIERRAALWGDRTAVVDHPTGETLSYADLATSADRVAGRLAALGVGAGDAVSLVSRNRPASLVLPFAARRLGAVFAPLSHHLPPSAVAAPHDAVSPTVVVHESAQRDLVRGIDPDETLTLDALRDVEPADYPLAPEDPGAPLLALHAPTGGDVATGGHGATGGDDDRVDAGEEGSDAGGGPSVPVVEYPVRAVEWNCVTEAAAWGLGRSDSAPLMLALSHATGLLGLALPLLYVGGRVVVLRAFDPDDALAVVAEREPTCALGRAPELRELGEAEGFEGLVGSSLSWVACADRVPDGVRAAFAAAGVSVFRTFGTLETGPNDLYVPPERAPDAPPDSVGRPFPDCEVRLLDAGGDPVESGAVGLLAVRGPVVAGGYVAGGDDRFDDEWVSTGALARRAADGDYHVVGPGVAVGATEGGPHDVAESAVEEVLAAHDGVTAAAVVGGGATAVVAGDVDADAVVAHAARLLPDEAVPEAVRVVDALPRRETGRVDRERLRRRFGADDGGDGGAVEGGGGDGEEAEDSGSEPGS